MKTKLILVEGLPGFGKTTTAQLIHELLTENNIDAELFMEGNLDHPADYDGVAYFSEEEFNQLLVESGDMKEVFKDRAVKKENHYFLPYVKLLNEYGDKISDHIIQTISKNDIYELPFEKNLEVITKKWAEFSENAISENKTYIFECCFIQNPMTIGMVKYGVQKEKVIDYVIGLAKNIEKLNPVLVYVEQDNLEFAFKKAMNDRPKEWSIGFIDYYTNQGFGKEQGLEGVEGTLKVLTERRIIENEIYEILNLKKVKLNNTKYKSDEYKTILHEKLSCFGLHRGK